MSFFKSCGLMFLIFVSLMIALLYFGVQNPGGGCGTFSRQVAYESYQKLNLQTCGEEQRGDDKNIMNITTCIQKAIDTCEEKKAYIRRTGIESSSKYIITTSKDCKVTIEGGSCSIHKETCDKMPELRFSYTTCD